MTAEERAARFGGRTAGVGGAAGALGGAPPARKRPQTVYVLGADNKLTPVEIRTGITDGHYTQVVSGDLKPGDNVVIGLATSKVEANPPPGSSRSDGRRRTSGRRRQRWAVVPDKVIEIHGLTKVYSMGEVEVRALAGVDLLVDEGEFLAVMGPSGSGKSTLMNILGCLDRPTDGTYKLDGIDVSTLDRDERAVIRNAKIGFVFQSFNLLARTSAVENVELPLIYGDLGWSREERHKAAMDALHRVGLKGREHNHPSQLSGGQQQRVAIARALVTDPAMLLADEPTGNLDSRTSEEIMGIFQSLNDSGKTVVLITHEPDIAQHAKRVVTVRDGVIQHDEKIQQHRVDVRGIARAGRAHARGGNPMKSSVMRISNITLVGLRAIARNKMRSFLTALGIIIGVGCVIAVVAIGNGATKSVENTINSLGTNYIMVFPGASTSSGARMFTGNSTLTADDADAIKSECPAVAYVAPTVRAAGQIVAGELNWGTSIQGVGVDYPLIRSWNVSDGAFFTDQDVKSASKVCVLGKTVADNLFPTARRVGQIVRIKNVPFKVVGVLEKKGGNMMGQDQDDTVVAPYTTVMKRLSGKTKIDMLQVSAASAAQVQEAQNEIDAVLRQRHRIPPERRRRFSDALAGRDRAGAGAADRHPAHAAARASPRSRCSSAASAS